MGLVDKMRELPAYGISYIPITEDIVRDRPRERETRNPKVLAIGAHPDDIELGAAMTIWELNKSSDIHYIICTNGEASKRGNSTQRVNESIEAARMMKVEGVFYLNLSDMYLPYEKDLIKRIEYVMSYTGLPDIMFIHSKNERHQDHITVANTGLIAGRDVEEIYMYSTPSQLSAFQPSVFHVYKQEAMERKGEILKIFKSQINGRDNNGIINIDSVITEAKFWSQRAKTHNEGTQLFTEAFEIGRLVKYSD